MKTLALFLALSLALVASAQMNSKVPGLTLTGPLADPVVENHSGKTVLWALWSVTKTGQLGGPSVGSIWLIDLASGTSSGLPDGASAKAAHRPIGATATSATITEAVFADGEFRGEDKGPMRHDIEVTFQLMRETLSMAKTGDWDKIKARIDEDDLGIFITITAKKLLKAHDDDQAHGNNAAMTAAMTAFGYIDRLPASTWTGNQLLNQRRYKVPFIQALVNWISPVSALAQTDPCQLPNTCPAFDTGTIIQYPQSGTWVANCAAEFAPPA